MTGSKLILPSNGPKLWPEVNLPPILSPTVRRAPRRPTKLRRKDNDEPKSNRKKGKRNQEIVRCTRCKALGHNQKTCKGKKSTYRFIPPGRNKVMLILLISGITHL